MKKKFIAMIALSSVGLLLGGLIYLGISSFPELLESEKSVEKVDNLTPVINEETVVVEEEKMFEQPSTAIETVGGFFDYIPSFFDESKIEYVDAPNDIIFSASTNDSFTEDHPVIIEQTTFPEENSVTESVEEPVIVEQPISEEDTSNSGGLYISHSQIKEESSYLHASTAKKSSINRNKSVRSNQAVVETSLLVIGAVDLLSVILIKRKKRLFR